MAQEQFAGELSADRFTIKRLLELARAGSLRIPPFQRPLRWRKADHLLLLDSLYRRYPVGTLLLWQRRAPAATVVFGGVTFSAPDDQNAFWIVDGQQRIASVVGCLLRPDSSARRRSSEFSFVFDLEADVFREAVGEPAAHLVPVNQLHDPVQTSVWARDNKINDMLHRRAQEVGSRLLGYEVPTYVTRTESDDVLRTIFDRANTAGRRMLNVEVFEALNKAFGPTDSPAGLTERLQEVLYALDFGKVDAGDLQRTLVCVAGHNPKTPLPEALRAPGAAVQWEQATADGLRRTVEFLRDAAQIPHSQMLPYALPLIILPRFFHLYPTPGERSIELLVRWVWRGIARQSHMATNQNFQPLYSALKRVRSEEELVQEFLKLVGATRPSEIPRSRVYSSRGAMAKLELAVLFSLGPRHLKQDARPLVPVEFFEESPSDQSVQLEMLVETREENTRPRAPLLFKLPSLPTSTRELSNAVASRFLHPPFASKGDFAKFLSHSSRDVLKSHGIPASLEPAVRACEWDRVVEGRRIALADEVELTIDRLARWDEDGDMPSIDSVVADSVLEGAL